MQNDKELSFRIYSAGAAQKPNRLEPERPKHLLGRVNLLLVDLLLGIILGAFAILGHNKAGEGGELWTETERSLVAGGRAVGGYGAHFKLIVYWAA